MALLWFSCPHCRVLFHIDDANAGRQVACRACGNPIRIPGPTPKPSIWYYTHDRKPVGPVTFEQLVERARAGEVAPHELVWQEGTPQWVEARAVDGLYPTPPPLPQFASSDSPAPVVETTVAVADNDEEPAIEIVEDAPVGPPVPAAPEPPFQATPESAEPAVPSATDSPSLPILANWDVVENRPAETETPIQVEPEFTIDFAAAPTPPVRRAAPPQPANTALPADVAVEKAAGPPEIELMPVEPKLELGEPDEFGPPTAYDVRPGSGWDAGRRATVPPAPAALPEPYAVEGVTRPATAEATAIASTPLETVPPPMAIPVGPTALPPPRETEEEKRERLGREYRRERKAWTSVRTGIGLLYLALAFWFAVIAGAIIIGMMVAVFTGASANEPSDSETGSELTNVLLVVLALAVDAVSTIGFVYCLKVPENAGSRTLAIVALAMTGVALLAALVAAFVPVMLFVVVGIDFVRWVAFLFFLQTVACYFEAHFVAKNIERLLVLLVFSVAVCLSVWLGMAYLRSIFAKGSDDTAATLTLIFATLCTSLPVVILLGLCTMRYLHVMRDMAATIDQRLYRG
jgi:hypothetical protein